MFDGHRRWHAIEIPLPTLREFYRLGVRYMTLTWNNTHNWADAGRGEKKHNGLNEFWTGSCARDEPSQDA